MNIGYAASCFQALRGIYSGGRQFGGPVMGSLSISTRCNIRCIHCYYHSPLAEAPNFPEVRSARKGATPLPTSETLKRYDSVDTDPRTVREVIDQILAMGTRRFSLSSFGEMFLHPDIMEFIGRIKHSGATCISNTNGTLLTEEIIDQLIKYGLNELRVTTMAGTAEDYVLTHPGCTERTFEKLKNNLLYLAEAKAATGSKFPLLDLVCIVVSTNAHRLREFTQLAIDIGADKVTFRALNDVRDPGLKALLPTDEDAEFLRRELPAIKRDLDARNIPNNINMFLMTFGKHLDTRALYRAIPCYQGWISAYIDPLGYVRPCCNCTTSFGNINDQPFPSIWGSPQYEAFRGQTLTLLRYGVEPEGCDCSHCVHHTLNLRVYRVLHPLRGRSKKIAAIVPQGYEE